MPVELTIERLGRQGEGVATHGGHPVFVPYALPGERLLANLENDRAATVELLESSASRIEPFCKHFGACGGCAVQHLSQAGYFQWKQGIVAAALRREGLVTDLQPLVMAHGQGRRRATLHGRKEGAGFNAARSHKVHVLDHCPVLAPALAQAPGIVAAVHAAVGDCDATLTETGGGLDCAVKAHKHARLEGLVPIAERFDLARIALNGETVVTRRPPEIAIGRSHVALPPGSFLQPTQLGEETLAGLVDEAAGKARHVADLFCGIGPFALRLALSAKVHAFDNDAPAIAALKDAVRKTQGTKPLVAEGRDLLREPLTAGELSAYDAVVFDPPRAGAEMQSRQLAKSKVPKVIAVSCDPGTFARDAHILVAGGYRFQSATPIDQFAWSPHVEIVGVFSR